MAKKKTTTKTKKSKSKSSKTKSKAVKKKPAVKKKKAVVKKTTRKKAALKKKTAPKRKPGELFILSMGDENSKAQKDEAKKKKPLPVIDLDQLTTNQAKSVALMKESEKHLVTTGARISFYLGAFFGAVAINVFLLTLLTVFSI